VSFLGTGNEKNYWGLTMPSYEKNLIKLLRAVDLLASPSGSTIQKLENELGVSRRSVYRMLDALQELNFPVYDEAVPLSREKRWRLEESYVKKLPNIDVPNIKFTIHEVVFLHYLLSKTTLLRNTKYESSIKSLSKKLGLVIAQKNSDCGAFSKLADIFIFSDKIAKDYSEKEEVIDSLLDAIMKQKTCLVTYHAYSTDEVRTFSIDPLKIVEHLGGLYVFVNVTRFGDIRILAVDRIHELQISDATFEIPTDFDPEMLLESAFQLTFEDPIEVEIWFAQDQARYIEERMWAKEQEIRENDDGSIILKMKTSGVFDLKKWILSFGSYACVVKPKSFRKEIERELSDAMARYNE
jgi:predicted DNA-binding transcriptional regulator YafY